MKKGAPDSIEIVSNTVRIYREQNKKQKQREEKVMEKEKGKKTKEKMEKV